MSTAADGGVPGGDLPSPPDEAWRDHWQRTLAARRADSTRVLVVIDDDPTGTQPVHGLPVVTSWEPADLRWALEWAQDHDARALFVSTNSRSMDVAAARQTMVEALTAAYSAAADLGVDLDVLSRGDSTLRGHLWAEIDTVVDVALAHGRPTDGIVVVPAYPEAGRVTVHGEHGIIDEHQMVPLAKTDYARDPTFGYSTSFLPDYLAEVSGGAWPASRVTCLDLATMRDPDEQAVVDALRTALHAPRGPEDGPPVVVPDVLEYADLHRLAAGLLALEREGARVICRAGPSFARVLSGVLDSPMVSDAALAARPAVVGGPRLTPSDLGGSRPHVGGLTVVGSHVGLSSRQLAHLERTSPRTTVEVDAPHLLARGAPYVEEIATDTFRALQRGHALLATSRRVVEGPNGQASLWIAQTVADALVAVVRRIVDRADPAYIVAKGGITSSTLFSAALGASRAVVLGSVLPGLVSVWRPVDGRRPGLPYVVFAGNVGDESALTTVLDRLETALPIPNPQP